jgi:hypothetical protein
MRGKVIHYDWSTNTGIISGDNGNRYYFVKDAWKDSQEPVRGLTVDFVIFDTDKAQEIITLRYISTDEACDWLVTLLLCIFLGAFGVHRFYTKQVGIGILQLITAGGCGIWIIIDVILIVTDTYRDGNGKALVRRF